MKDANEKSTKKALSKLQIMLTINEKKKKMV